MATKQSGTIKDTAAPPFATRDGKPTTGASIAKGTDFARDPIGQAKQAGGRDFTATDNRRQDSRPVEVEGPASPALGMSLPQRPGGIESRANMADAGKGGGRPVVDSPATVARGGTAGVAHSPMKLGGTPAARPPVAPSRAPSASASSSQSRASGDERDTVQGFPGMSSSESRSSRGKGGT